MSKTIQERSEDGKAERSAAASRDNLKRRKAQQRARDEPDRPGGQLADTEPPDRRKP